MWRSVMSGCLVSWGAMPACSNCSDRDCASCLLLPIISHMAYLSMSQSVITSAILFSALFSLPSLPMIIDCTRGCEVSKGKNQWEQMLRNLQLCSVLMREKLGSRPEASLRFTKSSLIFMASLMAVAVSSFGRLLIMSCSYSKLTLEASMRTNSFCTAMTVGRRVVHNVPGL